MQFNDVLVERRDGKGYITINRPEVLNATGWETLEHIQIAADELIADPSVRVIIITGAGEKAFIAGGDLEAEVKMTDFSAYRWGLVNQKLCTTLEDCAKPVIAAINGYALGGGCELALACDFRICVETAKMGLPETKVGVICGGGGTYRLARLIGKGKAKELLMTADMIDAQEAYRLNLVNRVAPKGKLMEVVDEFCAKLLNKGAIALELTKRAVDYGESMDLHSAAHFEAALFGAIGTTNDKVEGMSAFLEKRPAKFTDS